MNSNLILLETEGEALQKIHHTTLLQALETETLYIGNLQMAIEIIADREIGVIIAHFGRNLKDCHNFCLQARKQAPSFIIIILLNDEHSGEVANKIKYAHQTLALSCSNKEIVGAIERGLIASREIQKNPKLTSLLSKLESLPSPPSVYFNLRENLDMPSCNASSLSKLIARDPVLAAKILRIANSGFYAVSRTISDLQQAIALLGTETLLGLVLATHVYDSLPLPGLNLENLWKHAIGVGLLSREIAKDQGANQSQIESSGIAGLLHDLGSLVFISNKPAEYQAILRKAKGFEPELVKYEKQAFEINHAELGGFVLMLWGLPDSTVNAVKDHHNYDLRTSQIDSSVTSAVVFAEWMFNFPMPLTDEHKEEFLKTFPFDSTADRFDHWCHILEEVHAKI